MPPWLPGLRPPLDCVRAIRNEVDLLRGVLCGGDQARLRTIGMATSDQPWSRLAGADTVIVPGLDEPDPP